MPVKVSSAKQYAVKGKLDSKQQDGILTIYNDDFSVSFDETTGWLADYQYQGQLLTSDKVTQPLKANFWRAPTDNDLGNGLQKRAKIWQQASDSLQLKQFTRAKQGNGMTVTAQYISKLFKGGYQVDYNISADGRIKVTSELTLAKEQELPDIPRIGMQLVMPGQYQFVHWFWSRST